MDRLVELDIAATKAINGWSAPWADSLMTAISGNLLWFFLYALIIFLVTKKYGWKQGLLAIVFVALTFLATDRLSCIVRDAIGRLRPCEDPVTAGAIRLLENRGSRCGFPSAHACNAFALAFISSTMIGHKPYTICVFIWAAVVSYSRIYVGKHFLGDVLAGALMGVLLAAVIHAIYLTIRKYVFNSRPSH